MYVVLWWVWGTHVCGVVVGMGDMCVVVGMGEHVCGVVVGMGDMCVLWWWIWGTHVCVVVVDMGDVCVCLHYTVSCVPGYDDCSFTSNSGFCFSATSTRSEGPSWS